MLDPDEVDELLDDELVSEVLELEFVLLGCVTLVATDEEGVVVSFDVASRYPPIPAVAMTAIDPIETTIFVAVFTHSP